MSLCIISRLCKYSMALRVWLKYLKASTSDNTLTLFWKLNNVEFSANYITK